MDLEEGPNTEFSERRENETDMNSTYTLEKIK